MRIKSRNRIMVSFSLSGMTDIVFLLLLFFMLTSTLVAPNALKLLLPQAGKTSEAVQQIPEVELQKAGVILVDGRSINFDKLENILDQVLADQADPSFKLITSDEVTVKETVKIMNVAAANNYKVVLIRK